MQANRPGPIARRAMAVRRGIRFRTKQFLGKRTRILAEIRWRLGDEIMAIPIYESIKRAWPQSELSVACSFPDLLEGNPHVDHIIADESRDTADYDRHINLRNASRTVPRHKHYARLAGVPSSRTRPTLYWALDDPPLDMTGQWIAIGSGATWPTKRWPVSGWRELCNTLHDRGCQLVQLGRADERIGLEHDFVDKTSIREAGAILNRCSLFVGSDSGLLHLAAAVGTPAIGLFGPTDPDVLFGEYNPIAAIGNGRPCAACWNGPMTMREPGVCPLNVDNCMESITVDAVLAAALAALKLPKSADRCA